MIASLAPRNLPQRITTSSGCHRRLTPNAIVRNQPQLTTKSQLHLPLPPHVGMARNAVLVDHQIPQMVHQSIAAHPPTQEHDPQAIQQIAKRILATPQWPRQCNHLSPMRIPQPVQGLLDTQRKSKGKSIHFDVLPLPKTIIPTKSIVLETIMFLPQYPPNSPKYRFHRSNPTHQNRTTKK